MKGKLFFLLLVFCVSGTGLFAQSLETNEDYRKSVELADQSQAAMEEGDYEAAAALAIESQEYAARSRKYIEDALLAYRSTPTEGPEATYVVKHNPVHRDSLWRIAGYDFIYGDSTQWRRLYNANRDTFPDPDNPDLIVPGQVLRIPALQSSGLAASYVVKPRDSLWRIAGYDFIYGDSTQWRRLYDANRDGFSDSDNPDLILPGQILQIPSIRGEARSGRR
ncbi:hypothetical protein FACS189468_4890 [Spirochaetia bacterium]|nr:hypothetical protein FACS189468_4890 [Spirochaetia bacterium]